MTIEEMQIALKSNGATKRYKPIWENETGCIHITTRRPVKIAEGRMHGCEIVMMPDGTFRIWTDQKKKAKVWAEIHKIQFWGYDGEAELFVPGSPADRFLPAFGAKIKQNRPMSPERREALKQGLAKYRQNAHSCSKTLPKQGDPGPGGPREGGEGMG